MSSGRTRYDEGRDSPRQRSDDQRRGGGRGGDQDSSEDRRKTTPEQNRPRGRQEEQRSTPVKDEPRRGRDAGSRDGSRDEKDERNTGRDTGKGKDDQVIQQGEYTKAMSKDWHSGHFACWNCDKSLTGHRYILREDHPYCVRCYEELFANECIECHTIIGADSKDLSYKDKHWHERCFMCSVCKLSLVDKPFGARDDRLYCADCHDEYFASRCDGCGKVFKAGTKKMEYKGQQWHEQCFVCTICKSPIGTRSFIPKDDRPYCVACYEERFATRCTKCNKVITSGGVTYRGEPFHRECFNCYECTVSLAGQRFTSRDERPYCADCFGKLFAKKCADCGQPITGIGGTKFISFEDRHWHNECFVCGKCETSLVGRGFITEADEILCPDCGRPNW